MRANRVTLALSFGALLIAPACFQGDATLGGYCESNSDCGADQTCTNNVCGRCGNGVIDEGEVCFGSSVDRGVMGDIASMVPLDMDEDGDLDVVAAVNITCPSGMGPQPCWRIFIVFNEQGDYTVMPADDGEGQPGTVNTLIVDDLDGDGGLDFALALEEANAVLVSLDSEDESVITLPQSPRTMTQADFNGDGHLDLVVGTEAAPSVYTLLSDGQGGFGSPIQSPAPAGSRLPPRALDLTGDGRPDLVTVGRAESSVALLASNGDGTFSQIATYPLEGGTPSFVTLGDLEGDGDVDVVVTDPGLDVAYLLRSNGTMPFVEQTTVQTGQDPTYAVIDDLNGDGAPDLLVSNTGEDNLSYYVNRDGAFPDELVLDVSVAPQTALRADIDGDGVNDLLVANRNQTLSLLIAEP